MEKVSPKVGSIYKHFKGNKYEIIGTAVCTETGKELVLYVSLSETHKPFSKRQVWARSKEMFLESITRDGQTFKRFEKI